MLRLDAHGRAQRAPRIFRRAGQPAATPRQALPHARDKTIDLVPIEPKPLPNMPGDPGTCWRDSAGRVRRVPKARQRDQPPPPAAAARKFVAWMQAEGLCGERAFRGPDGIWDYYLWQCEEEGCHPLADNLFSPALKALLRHREVNDYSSGRRQRSLKYTIPAAEAVAVAPRQRRRKAA